MNRNKLKGALFMHDEVTNERSETSDMVVESVTLMWSETGFNISHEGNDGVYTSGTWQENIDTYKSTVPLPAFRHFDAVPWLTEQRRRWKETPDWR